MFRYLLAAMLLFTTHAFGDEFSDAIETIQNVRLHGDGNIAAIDAIKTLSLASPERLPTLLAAMTKGNDVANNWLRAAAESLADKATRESASLPLDQLQELLDDPAKPPRGRELAFDWLVAARGTAFETNRLPK